MKGDELFRLRSVVLTPVSQAVSKSGGAADKATATAERAKPTR